MPLSGLCLQCETSLHVSQPCLSNLIFSPLPFWNRQIHLIISPWVIYFVRMRPKSCLGLKQSTSFPQHLCFRTFYTSKSSKLCWIWIYHQDPDSEVIQGHLCWKLCPWYLQKVQDCSCEVGLCPSQDWMQRAWSHCRWACAAVTTLIPIRWGL